MTDFNYKEYSLENLENWLHDAISSAEATPQEIYDTIKNVVEEEYHYYKQNASRCDKLLGLLNGEGKDHISSYESYINSAYKDDIIIFNTKDEVKSCGVGDTSEYCKNSWNDFWEENYYPQEYKLSYPEAVKSGYEMTGDGFWIPSREEDKVTKWVLPVQLDGLTGDCYINLPDDLLELAGLKEGDTVEWISNNDGTFIMRKHNAI